MRAAKSVRGGAECLNRKIYEAEVTRRLFVVVIHRILA